MPGLLLFDLRPRAGNATGFKKAGKAFRDHGGSGGTALYEDVGKGTSAAAEERFYFQACLSFSRSADAQVHDLSRAPRSVP